MSDDDTQLCNALEDWREEKTKLTYGVAHLIDLGPTLIMPNEVLDRIVDCAHHLKIRTTEDLARETQWDEATLWGPQILTIVQRFQPAPAMPPPLSSVPLALQPLSTLPIQHSAATKDRSKTRCGACGKVGHNRSNRLCDLHPNQLLLTTTSSTSKENLNIGQTIPPRLS
ncbi:hypothetical protein B0H34DRAFT_724382 [Crassisporium funariophilum]|nr:hypothetical protein B0H34DRAFT_724382 [Crassisporium funariophilum]